MQTATASDREPDTSAADPSVPSMLSPISELSGVLRDLAASAATARVASARGGSVASSTESPIFAAGKSSTPSEDVQIEDLRKELKRSHEDSSSQQRAIAELNIKQQKQQGDIDTLRAANLELEKKNAALVCATSSRPLIGMCVAMCLLGVGWGVWGGAIELQLLLAFIP